SKFEDGVVTELVAPQSFVVKALNNASLPVADRKMYDEFCKKVSEARRASGAASEYKNELGNRLKYIKGAITETPGMTPAMIQTIHKLSERLQAINMMLNGDGSLARREFETLPSVNDRIGTVESGMWSITSAPTATFRKTLEIAEKQLRTVIADLKSLNNEIIDVEKQLDQLNAPYTPGRLPDLK
nr:glycosyl hydrolase [Bacteroidia bacterium]